MNNMILSLPSAQAVPTLQAQKKTTVGSDVFQSLFQQATAKTNNEILNYPEGSVPEMEDLQDKQDMQVVLKAFFDKSPSEDSLDLKEQPEDAWELVEQVLGEDILAAFLPTQLKNKAEEVLRNIKPSEQESGVQDILAQLAELQIKLANSDAAANSNGIGAFLQQTLPAKTNSAALSTLIQAGNQSSETQAENTDVQKHAPKDLSMATTSPSNKRDALSLFQPAKAMTATNTMDSQTVRNQTALQELKQTPKLTEAANAIRQVVEAAKDETAQTSKAGSTQPKQELQNFDAKQVSTLQVSKQEQLVFHLKQAEQAPEQAGKELVQKIEQAVKFSGMLSDRNGLKELSIQLRPGNLGDLQVKLVRENGDITVQIVAASKQAKEMLDSNISSLKHMFSPHQVSITERVDQIQTASSERSSQQQFQDANEEQQNRERGQQEQHSQDSFDAAFAEILSEQEELKV
ncbi:flagellar hook-length control protein FliK [Terribacillus sp. 179-K 1B1 HS]|uniref:flagellar hook-length control protein FliK n=1 Tax=Terribacillus sp. 179-K 1B1 HS TaxID=3142388 RepID=UPI0039A18F1D